MLVKEIFYLVSFLTLALGFEKGSQGWKQSASCNGTEIKNFMHQLEEVDNTTLEAIKMQGKALETVKEDLEIFKAAVMLSIHSQPCDCNLMGSVNDTCDPMTKRCPCFEKYAGRLCNGCKNGLYNFPQCTDCQCNIAGTYGATCDKTSGECLCKNNFKGSKCNECKTVYVTGPNCDRCIDNYYSFPNCEACNCNSKGSTNQQCDRVTGQCPCSERHQSIHCDSCLTGRFGFPDCFGTYNVNKTGPHLLLVGGHDKELEDNNRYEFHGGNQYYNRYNRRWEQKKSKRELLRESIDSKGQFSDTSTVEGIEALYLGENNMARIADSNEGFDYNMAAMLNGVCVLCKAQGSNYKCKSFTMSNGGIKLKISPVVPPVFAVDETSTLVSLEGGILRVRSDYHVDVMSDITQTWKEVRTSSFSLMDKFGSLRCATKFNDTTIVGMSGISHNAGLEKLMLLFFDVQGSRWRTGSRVSSPSTVVKAVINCQMSGDSTLLVEILPGEDSASTSFYSIETNVGLNWDSDWFNMKRDFNPSWGTLVGFNDGLLYVGGVSNQDSKALLYKDKESSEWIKLDQKLIKERVKPAVCIL